MQLKKTLSLLAIGTLTMTLFGCASNQAKQYQNNTPTLTIQKYFNGPLKAYGMLQNWNGKQTRRFDVSITGVWKNDKEGQLHEFFVFNDGEKQTRDWTLTMADAHHFIGTAHDVVGEAKGEQYGNTIHMQYTLRVKVNGKDRDINIDDWLYAINDKVVINRSTLSKFGLTLGQLTITFSKE